MGEKLRAVLQKTERGNDVNDNRDDPEYMNRIRLIDPEPRVPMDVSMERERQKSLRAHMAKHGVVVDEEMMARQWPGAEFVWGAYTARQMVTLLVSMGGLGKSQLGIMSMVCLAYGRNVNDLQTPIAPSRVLLVSLEDNLNVVMDRVQKAVAALSLALRVPVAEINREITTDGRFAVLPLYGTEFTVASPIPGGAVMVTPDLSILKGWIQEQLPNGVDQITIDTLVRSHQADENDNGAMAKVLVAFEQLARDTNASVMLLAHVPKTAAGERGSHVARGAGAITDNARSSINLTPATSADVKDFGNVEPEWVDEENPRLMRLTHAKSNYGPRSPAAWFLLRNGWIEPFEPQCSVEPVNVRVWRAVYSWWVGEHKSLPVTRTSIDGCLPAIQKYERSVRRQDIRGMLEWGKVHGHVQTVSKEDAERAGVQLGKWGEYVRFLPPPPPKPAKTLGGALPEDAIFGGTFE